MKNRGRLFLIVLSIVLQFVVLQSKTEIKNGFEINMLSPDRYVVNTNDVSVLKGLSDEVSFCIVDLKFDGSTIQICELGDMLRSSVDKHALLFGSEKAIWSAFWDRLDQFGLPIWLVPKRSVREWKKFYEIGGKEVKTFEELEKDSNFKVAQKNYSGKKGIKNHTGILIGSPKRDKKNRRKRSWCQDLLELKKKYPGLLILGEVSNRFVRSKYKTGLLFDDPDTSMYKPKFKIYLKKYTPQFAKNIIRDIGGDIFVIKPFNGTLGLGVIMVEKENLDSTLKLIFTGKSLPKKYHNDTSYTYWKRGYRFAVDRNKSFIVEEFVRSKDIEVDGKIYDPAMRVIFTLIHDASSIEINFLGSYWKLAAKSLDEEGSLIEKSKSDMTHLEDLGGRPICAKVSTEDFETVKKQLIQVLPSLYIKMLVKNNENSLSE